VETGSNTTVSATMNSLGFLPLGRSVFRLNLIDGAWVDVPAHGGIPPVTQAARPHVLAQNETNSSDHVAVRQFEAA
jgi:hypothetical protein